MAVKNMKLTVSYTDGREVEVVVTPKTQVAFEREHNRSLASIAEKVLLTDLYWLAWNASHVEATFDDWLDQIDGVSDPDQEVAPASPLPVDQSAA